MLRRLAMRGLESEGINGQTPPVDPICTKGTSGVAFFVVPFVSLAEEKAAYLRKMWTDMHIGVRAMHGEDGGTGLARELVTGGGHSQYHLHMNIALSG